MLFNSWQFAVFLPIVFSLYWVLPHKYRWGLILASSYYFYACWNVKYLSLIVFITIMSYLGGIWVEKAGSNIRKKKIAVAMVVIVSLSILFVFKYLNFAVNTITQLLSCIAISVPEFSSSLLLPVGISFYTFQAIGYVIDVYRGDVVPEKNFGKYAAFIAFFPQLVAGPIERTRNLLPQLKQEHFFNYDKATYGLKLMAWGYFKKIVIADTMAIYVDHVYRVVTYRTGFSRLLVIFFFAIQIYCDFSGYSDIARGTAKLFDIDLMENFKSPYFSTSIKEFWHRWHISLSSWLRDYIYIPLGGSRRTPIRNAANVLLTFTASGIWHGAAWTYVVWGMGHGTLQVLENWGDKAGWKDKIHVPRFIKILINFIVVSALWTVFRAKSIYDAAYMCLLCFLDFRNPVYWMQTGITDLGLDVRQLIRIVLMILLLFLFDYFALKRDVIESISKCPVVIRWGIYITLVVLIFLWAPASSAEFIYFDF